MLLQQSKQPCQVALLPSRPLSCCGLHSGLAGIKRASPAHADTRHRRRLYRPEPCDALSVLASIDEEAAVAVLACPHGDPLLQLASPQRGLLLQGMLSTQAMSPLLTGNSKTTSLPVSFLYTDPKVSSLYSVEFLSLGSKYTCKHHAQFRCPAHCMTQLVRVPK